LNNNTAQLMDLIERETKKRIETYHDYAPGTDKAEVTPFKVKNVFPAIYFTLILVALFIYGAVYIFPRYFPN